VKKLLSFLFPQSTADQNQSKQFAITKMDTERGFALIEMVVALVIMALVGLMAWRGMDAMIRGREVIDKRANQDADYSQLVRQFERDCQSVLSKDEITSLTGSMSGAVGGSVGNSGAGTVSSSVAAGAKNIWFLRRYRADNIDAWLIAGYVISPAGLQRWTSRPLTQRTEAGALWSGIARDPDLSSSDLLLSLELPSIVRQSFQVQTSVLSGAGGSGISAGGTGSPGSSATASSATAGSNAGTGTNPNPGTNSASGINAITPDQQGVVMQWWVKDVALPITRACLMGGAL
jgi:prepilin-type N-terminal cleavage/methylation domain-containing protein